MNGDRFYDGKPCRNCGNTRRSVRSSSCVECTSKLEQTRRTQYRLAHRYGITEEEYNTLLESQNFKCASCELPAIGFTRKLAVDHCHKTGKVRGLLCVKCNTALGLLNEDISRLESLIQYIKDHNVD